MRLVRRSTLLATVIVLVSVSVVAATITGWTTPNPFIPATRGYYQQLAVSGDVVAAPFIVDELSGRSVRVATRGATGWSGAVTVSDPAHYASKLASGVDQHGRMLLAWVEAVVPGGQPAVMVSSWNGSAWSAPVELPGLSGIAIVFGLSVAFDEATGRAVVAAVTTMSSWMVAQTQFWEVETLPTPSATALTTWLRTDYRNVTVVPDPSGSGVLVIWIEVPTSKLKMATLGSPGFVEIAAATPNQTMFDVWVGDGGVLVDVWDPFGTLLQLHLVHPDHSISVRFLPVTVEAVEASVSGDRVIVAWGDNSGTPTIEIESMDLDLSNGSHRSFVYGSYYVMPSRIVQTGGGAALLGSNVAGEAFATFLDAGASDWTAPEALAPVSGCTMGPLALATHSGRIVAAYNVAVGGSGEEFSVIENDRYLATTTTTTSTPVSVVAPAFTC